MSKPHSICAETMLLTELSSKAIKLLFSYGSLNSILYKLPYTNKSARFGSGENGSKWDINKQVDTTPANLIIN